ncbi:MAG: polysaccharide biosynthesis/export family protein [Hyphomicrobium sp.]|jgi:polysaccharide export outer membrane protein/exopolysaccharide production protein ExoF
MIENWVRPLAMALVLGYLILPPAGVIAAGSSHEAASAYRLGPQDKVSIKVYEWRPARDEIYEWSAFKAEHTVDSSGILSLPLLGSILARGLTTDELARSIGERLQDKMGLAESPDITIELVQHRPFYVVGAVEKPGEYPYRPGLTVLKAYAIAGGKPRSAAGLMRLEREAISTRGELDSMGLEEAGLRMRMARLGAELSNASVVTWPDALKQQIETGHLQKVAQQEQLVFDTRRNAFQTQLNALEQLQSYLTEEVQSLEKQAELHKVEVDSVKEESRLVNDLHKRGLAVTSRKLALERNVAQVDGDRLRLESSLMRARQEVSKTEISIIDLKAKRSSEVSAEMQKSQSRLDELQARTETARNLLFETETVAPQIVAQYEKSQDMRPIYKIVRDGRTLEGSEVSDATAILPDDTIIIEAPSRSRTAWWPTRSQADTASNASPGSIAEQLR